MALPSTSHPLSLVYGTALAEEPGLGPLTIGGYAREVTRRYAGNEALVMRTHKKRVSLNYTELWERSVAIAKALIAAGAAKDSRIGVLMTNRPEYVASVFGIALAGGVTVSLSTFSTAPELEYLLSASCISVLLFERSVLKKDFGAILVELEPQILSTASGAIRSTKFPFLRRLVALDSVTGDPESGPLPNAVETWDAFLAGGETVSTNEVEARATTAHPSDAGAIFFSSGTTNLPKGILHAQRALALQWWRWPRIMRSDPARIPVRSWTGNGFFWSGNISMQIGNALSTGGTIVLQPVFQAEEALALMQAERVTMPIGRPHQWARLQATDLWANADLSSLYYVMQGSELANHPAVKTDWRQGQAFGTTETLTINTAYPHDVPLDKHAGSYGAPLPGNILKIIDPDTDEIVPRGQRGEVCIKGPTLMMGYLGKTGEETFDKEGYFRTGDGGYVDDDGFLFWEGRLTELIKTGGANVSPVEVDGLIAKFPGVKLTQTVGIPDKLLGELVVACIVPQPGKTLDAIALRDYLKQQLASFKVPREILFFEEEEFSVTGSGKIKFKTLREIVAQRLSSGSATPQERA
jgi:acyl-CoA synthetase (AMP-forming)/AMP-acid ligase II